jgi:hypothetical protein
MPASTVEAELVRANVSAGCSIRGCVLSLIPEDLPWTASVRCRVNAEAILPIRTSPLVQVDPQHRLVERQLSTRDADVEAIRLASNGNAAHYRISPRLAGGSDSRAI